MKKNNNQIGFTLLELLLATAVASILLTMLLVIVKQATQQLQNTQKIISFQTRVALFEKQFAQDLAGIFSPQAPEEPEKKQSEPQKTAKDAPEKKETKKNPVTFLARNTDKNLELLAFATTNSVAAIIGAATDKPVARAVLVVYQLVPQKKNTHVFNLIREERETINFNTKEFGKQKETTNASVLIDGIAQLNISYGFILEKKGTEKEQKKQLKILQGWQSDDKEELPALPHFIYIDLWLWDAAVKKQNAVSFVFEIKTQVLPPPEKPQQPSAAPQNQPGSTNTNSVSQSPTPPGTRR